MKPIALILSTLFFVVATLATNANAEIGKTQGFIFRSQNIQHASNPAEFIRLGEKISPPALRKRFAGYQVRYANGEGCIVCAVIAGPGGRFEVIFAQDGRTVIKIASDDKRSRDAAGHSIGSAIRDAIGSNSAQCDQGESLTCAAPQSTGLSYIVAEDDRCQLEPKPQRLTAVPACARVAGFQIAAIEQNVETPAGYALLCKNTIVQSSDAGIKLGRLAPVTYKISFTGDETTWTDPKDKTETIFENLLITQGDEVRFGGRVKGSTYDSSTTFDGDFKTTGKGTINWGYAKSLQGFTVSAGAKIYLCNMQSASK